MKVYFLILLISIFEAIAQSSIKHAHDNMYYLFIGILFYIFVSLLIYKAYKHKGLGMVNAIWSGFSIIIMLCIGIFIFNEKIKNNEVIGIIFIIIGIILTNENCFNYIKNINNN